MKKYIVYAFLLFILFFLLQTLYKAGVFKSINPHSDFKNTHIYNQAAGPEDLDIDEENGLLFIASTDRWNFINSTESKDGIYLVKLQDNSNPYRLPSTINAPFHPHGISFFKQDDRSYLFAINHTSSENFIELLEFLNDTLFHLKTFQNELLNSPNDIVAINTDEFYFTNDHGNSTKFTKVLEDYLRLPLANVVHYKNDNYRKVFKGLHYANGITSSSDKEIIYVTETTGGKLSILDRNTTTGDLQLRFKKNLNSGLDNVTVDSDGTIWIASHPKLFVFVAHAKDPNSISPSQVFRLEANGTYDFDVEEIYLNEGEGISASSTALYVNGHVYIGCVFENKVLNGEYSK